MPKLNLPATLAMAFAGLAGILGCRNPEVHLSSMPMSMPTSAETEVQSRVLPLTPDKAFPRAVEVLLDMGFQIRSANREVGQMNIYKLWHDKNQWGKPQIAMEATLLFRPEGPDATRIRMNAIGQWKLISAGGKDSANADVSGAVPTQDPSDFKFFLDRLQEGICPAK